MHCAVSALLLSFACALLPAQDPETPETPPTETPPPRTEAPPAPRTASPRQAVETSRSDMVRDLAWRQLGPANPIGRVTDIDVAPDDASKWFIATGGGGVFRTNNAGTTWQSVTDNLPSASIGDVAVAPSDSKIVWIGTGEENARNSVQWGDGVYKSTDGGDTWTHMGLRETFQIGHIAIHPTNPDIVFVAALGRLWGDNEERGVYRTMDGGATWQRVFFVDAKTGCIDVRIDPAHPELVYACMYERRRNRFDDNDPAVRFGEGAGLWKSSDGGTTWKQLQNGLPTCQWGRSGIDVFQQKPDTLFLIVETERCGWAAGDRKDRIASDPVPPEEADRARRQGRQSAVMGIGTEGKDGGEATPGAVLVQVTDAGPAQKVGLQPGDRVTKVDEEEVRAYADLIEIVRDSRGGQTVKLTYVRGETTATIDLTFDTRAAAGAGEGPYSGGRLFGQQANKQTFQGELGYETGGIFRSDDRGETWRRLNSLTERPFYYSVIRVDPSDTKNLYAVGTTLWGSSDGGEKFEGINRAIHVDFHAFWIDPRDGRHLLAGCDGGVNESFDRGASWQVHHGFCAAQYYDVVADNSVPYNVVGGLQDNGTWVGPSRTRYREGITNLDWRTIYGGDGFGAQTDPVEPWIVFATSQGGALGLVDLRSGSQARIERERPREGTARFNWDAPFVLSPHNRLVIWSAGTYVYRADRYAHFDNRATRADLTPLRNDGSLRAQIVSPALGLGDTGTATALAESSRVPGLVYAGTDDGALWRGETGSEWKQLQDNLPGLSTRLYVSDLAPSQHRDGRVYATLDGHRSDDHRTLVFVSEDRGATWRSLASDLGSYEPCYAIAEDPRNENLLFLGTEYGCYVTLDRGEHWHTLGRGLPTVAVRDVFVHDRDADVVLATHGRGVYVCDIAPLRELDAATALADAHLFAPEDAILWRMQSRGFSGNREFRAPNPAYGAPIYVYLGTQPASAPTLTIHDVTGAEVAALTVDARRGLQALHWDARSGNRLCAPGAYAARLKLGEKTQSRAFSLHGDPLLPLPVDASPPTPDDRADQPAAKADRDQE